MSETDRLIANAATDPERYDADRPLVPSLGVAIVACMDARLPPFGLLGLQVGDAHVIRNAGGAVTPDDRVIMRNNADTKTLSRPTTLPSADNKFTDAFLACA